MLDRQDITTIISIALVASVVVAGAGFALFTPETDEFITDTEAHTEFAAKPAGNDAYVLASAADIKYATKVDLGDYVRTNAFQTNLKVAMVDLHIQDKDGVVAAVNEALSGKDFQTADDVEDAIKDATKGLLNENEATALVQELTKDLVGGAASGIPATACKAGAGFGNLQGTTLADVPKYTQWLNDTMFAHNGTVIFHQLGELGTVDCEVSADFKVVTSNVEFEDMPTWTYAPDTCVANVWPGQSAYLGKPLLAKVSWYMAERNNSAVKDGNAIDFRVSGTLGESGCKLYQQVRQGTGVPIKDLPASQSSAPIVQCTDTPSTVTNGKVSTVTFKVTNTWVQIPDPTTGTASYTWKFPDGVEAVWGTNWGSMTSAPMTLNGSNQNFGAITMSIYLRGYPAAGIGSCITGTLTAP